MASDNFKNERRHLSHNLLKNGFLLRLDAPALFFSRGAGTDELANEEREQALCASLEAVRGDSPNVNAAVDCWVGRGSGSPGVEQLVLALYADAISSVRVRPTPRFPEEDIVRSWLQDIRAYVEHAKSPAVLDQQDRHTLAHNASRSLRQLYDFLGALDIESPRFWQLFTVRDL